MGALAKLYLIYERLLIPFMNKMDANQPAYQYNLVSTLFIHYTPTHVGNNRASTQESQTFGFPTMLHLNQPVQLQRLAGLSAIMRVTGLSRKRITKALSRLCRCTGCSVPLLFD